MEDTCLDKKERVKPATAAVQYILLVEDDAQLRSFIVHLLKQAGHTVEVASNVDSLATTRAVLRARFAGLVMTASARKRASASRLPISGASRLPRLLRGRSMSGREGSFQLDLAWRRRARCFIAPFPGVAPAGELRG